MSPSAVVNLAFRLRASSFPTRTVFVDRKLYLFHLDLGADWLELDTKEEEALLELLIKRRERRKAGEHE